ncbi:hypothetical protein [Nocardioides terrisoli]|uniref:hypothetical protein n=1 Tax=Nocardioides terrisoli TaxID=3388267 RepID=UPI00287BBC50|nr:hypothetical protein [Nocardioides marmorisolisilvae]
MTPIRRRITAAALAAAAAVAVGTTQLDGAAASTHATQSAAAVSTAAHARISEDALRTAMRSLWEQHMEWTYATVAAFAAESPGLQATMNRLLRNQNDIGHAVRPFYGKAAAHRLTHLLRTHIKDAVPVLEAAKDGDQDALSTAVAAWYANAKRIADFLASANPFWHRHAMRRMMKTHITQTIAYAADQLQGKYALSIRDYGRAEAHMMNMADMLTHGLAKQFPHRFTR